MERKIRKRLLGILVFSMLNTFLFTFATNGSIRTNKSAVTTRNPVEYHCFWLPGGWDGPMARDCMGCVERPMEDPRVQGTCTSGIGG